MPFEPEKITAAHVLQAVQKIKRETIALAPSTGYDVIIEEEAYPPKEIMRYAHEQMNGELMWDKSGGPPTNQILEKLGFEIRSKPVNNQGTQSSGSSQIWKLGCLWDSGKPSFYEYIKEQQIVIGVSNKEYDASDLIVITEGYQVKAIALVLETPKPVTSNPDLQSGFKKYEIEYSESTLFAQAEWYELAQEERFQYRLQQGISKVQDIEIQNTARKLWNERHASFWVFQGNPKVYDFEGAMKEGVLQDWTVSAHKHRIEENDRAIIWITGKRSGCYALARVASSPKEKKEPSDDHLWKSEKKPPFSAEIEILTNLIETPILKAVVDSTPGLQNLKVGKQGTNFSATRNEYRILEKLAHSAMKNKPENQKVWPMNMILYGPPGTGKTYSTIDLAAKIIGFNTGSHAENLKAFNERIGKNIEFVTFHQSFAYEDFIEGIKPLTRDKQVVYEVQDGVFKKLAARAREEKTEETHVLIIDEINRGNVAAIFGELITLIEEDKRAGGKNPISTTLPYSKTEFAVPSNLYLIGTMNTADRSVEALDTALRRRFSFTEVGSQPELLSPKAMIVRLLNERKYADLGWEEEPYHSHARKLYDFLGVTPDGVEEPLRERAEVGEGYWEKADLEHLSPDDFTGVQLDKLLRTINLRIARLIDRDHMIGHAYFMGIATAPDPWQALKDVFHRNILPLLQEYFFGDYAKIGLVLGKGFVSTEKEEEKVEFADFYDEASAELASQMQYLLEDVSNMSLTDFKKAVWKISPDSNADKHG